MQKGRNASKEKGREGGTSENHLSAVPFIVREKREKASEKQGGRASHAEGKEKFLDAGKQTQGGGLMPGKFDRIKNELKGRNEGGKWTKWEPIAL